MSFGGLQIDDQRDLAQAPSHASSGGARTAIEVAPRARESLWLSSADGVDTQ